MLSIDSTSVNSTKELGKKFAQFLKKGDVVVLTGDLGSGKTKLTQGILSYFGLENEISSPTFTIVNEYTDSTIPIYHFDVYRLADIEEFYAIGGEEYFSKGICIIEWGELLENILPADYIKITINKYLENENYRKIIVETFGNIKL